MSIQNIKFKNNQGQDLSARITLPDDQKPHNYALFAHCFTCNKNLTAIKNITRSMTQAGFAVFSFDFTGLGNSEGAFEETNFSSNIDDLISAAHYLEEYEKSPTVIIGHSLGGAAAIFAGNQIHSVTAIATIGAPSAPEHVQHLFGGQLEVIKAEGEAQVNIGGRSFKVKEQFLKDVNAQNMKQVLSESRKALLVLHSPQDEIVNIENAKEIYLNAHHPKSFISVDRADHLLMNKADSAYVGNVISGWAQRYINTPKKIQIDTAHQVAVCIGNEGFTSEITAGRHILTADEPEKVGGDDFGPSPYDYVSSGLGACTAMTLRMYADRKKWDLQKVIVHVNYGKDYAEDLVSGKRSSGKIDQFERSIELLGNLDETQKQRLLEIADKCPVHKTLESTAQIKTQLI